MCTDANSVSLQPWHHKRVSICPASRLTRCKLLPKIHLAGSCALSMRFRTLGFDLRITKSLKAAF